MYERHELDVDAFLERDRTGPCFVCQIVACAPDASPHIIYEDAVAIAFLDKYPPEYGWTLVAPRAHRTQVTGDFTVDEYLQLQHLVYRVSEAVRYEVNAERMYLCSLGVIRATRMCIGISHLFPKGCPSMNKDQIFFALAG